ncbi:MAG: hypothetical protein IKF97_04890 [Clostridia bacterium]|nr:hypothetical protein [Clostridia bacterium]
MDKNVKIIYSKLENISFNKNGYVDLANSRISSKEDIKNICNIFRDPRYETFRIFYMNDNKIVGQEAFTSKIPDRVHLFYEDEIDNIKWFEKMKNRMKRLNADGYYLAHNHSSGYAKASQGDINLTQKIAKKIEGFLGHIIIGDYNRYSIIGKNNNGEWFITKECILQNEDFKSIVDSDIGDSLYNIKISGTEDLAKLLLKMQNKQDYSTGILTDTHNNIRMVLDIPNKMFNQKLENLNGFFKNMGRNVGANRVLIGTHNQNTYFKIIEHQRYGTFKDIIFIDKNNKVIKPNIKESPDLFDKEKKKRKKYRNAR